MTLKLKNCPHNAEVVGSGPTLPPINAYAQICSCLPLAGFTGPRVAYCLWRRRRSDAAATAAASKLLGHRYTRFWRHGDTRDAKCGDGAYGEYHAYGLQRLCDR